MKADQDVELTVRRPWLRWKWPVVLLGGTLSLSCSVSGMAKGKAAKELDCPREQMHIVSLGAFTKRAIGCQRWADYRCVNTPNHQVHCYRLSKPAAPPPTPEEWQHAHTPGVKDH